MRYPALQTLLTYRQTARRLGVSEATVRRMVERGQLERIELGPYAIRFDPADVDALIQRGRGRDSRKAVETRV